MNCPYCDQECEETEVNGKVVYFCIPCRQDFTKDKTGLKDRTKSFEYLPGTAKDLDEWLSRNSIKSNTIIPNREVVKKIRKVLK